MDRCMPWPLAVFCWADNISHDRHGDGPEVSRPGCRIHDAVLAAWLRVRALVI